MIEEYVLNGIYNLFDFMELPFKAIGIIILSYWDNMLFS